MPKQFEIRVTLSDDLLETLQAQARVLHVPLRWVIASLVCDTIDTVKDTEPAAIGASASFA